MTPAELAAIRARVAGTSPAPWRWQGEDYRGGWGWQLLVAADGGGIVVGQADDGGPCRHLRRHMRVEPALCVTGFLAVGKPHVEPVHVLKADAEFIVHAPTDVRALLAERDRLAAIVRGGFAGVVSFSDPLPRVDGAGRPVFRGHIGTIYQAHNGAYLGRSKPGALRLLSDGTIVHGRALAKVRNRERGWAYVVEQLVAAGAEPPRSANLRAWLVEQLDRVTRVVRHPGNHKYAWAFERAGRRALAELRRRLDEPSYPKRLEAA